MGYIEVIFKEIDNWRLTLIVFLVGGVISFFLKGNRGGILLCFYRVELGRVIDVINSIIIYF